MNPWAFLVILLGIVVIIIGIKGTQHNITGAITGATGPIQQQQQQQAQPRTTYPRKPV